MFLYTPDAVIGAGSETVMLQRIGEAVSEANFIYTNSQVNITINPVYMGSIQYSESGDIQADLDQLGYNNGQFSGVNALRDDYKADIVCLITEFENAGIGGLAWDIPALRGNAATAYLAVRRQALGLNTTLAHELGHLCGCAHDREHAGDSSFYLGLRSYIFGYRLEIQDVTYIDVMAYEPGVALPYFANPRIGLDGVALGIPEGGDLPSDTARTINETAPYVATYRQALSRIQFDTAETNVLQSAGAFTFHLLRTGDLSTPTRVKISLDDSSTAEAGVDYVLPGSTTLAFAAGQSEASLVFPLLAPGTAGSKTLRVSLASPLGAHGIGTPGRIAVNLLNRPPVVKQDSVIARENEGTIAFAATFTGNILPELPKITWRLESNSAVAGKDFVDASGELQIRLLNGAYQIDPVSVSLIDNSLPEPDRTFRLIFNDTTHGGITYGPVTNEIRIVDDDRPGSLIDAPGAQLAADGTLNALVRDDHKLLVWGGFSRLRGIRRTGIALLNADGSVDDSFRPPELIDGHRKLDHLPNASISSVQILADGKLLIAGEFARADGKPRTTLARLNPDGSLDETFGSDLTFDGSVDAMLLQPDGKILLGGGFENINGQRRAFIARLNTDGSVDEAFAPNGGPTSSWTVFVLSLALQADGKILIGGLFDQVDGINSPNLARLNPDGTLDPSFTLRNVSGPVMQVTCQIDGRIVIAGLFDTVADRESRKIARLNSDGSVDGTFQPPQPNAEVRNVMTFPDGRMLVSGAFTRIGGTDRRFVTMLKADGTLDPTFDLGTGPDDRVGSMTIHGDGSLYVPGRLQSLDGLSAAYIARVHFGPTSAAITGIELTPHGQSLLRAQVLPGGFYKVQRSDDLINWSDAATLNAPGFSREASITLPALNSREFLRFLISAE